MISSLLMALALLPSASAGSDAPVILENKYLLAEFSPKDGSIVQLRNKQQKLNLISQLPPSRQPWAMLLAPFDIVSDFTAFRLSRLEEKGSRTIKFEWETPYRVVVKTEARLADNSDELELRCSAVNIGDRTIVALRYPAVQGIGMLSENGASDRLLHSTMMGALFYDPFHLFQGGAADPSARGLTISRYPNGFHGSALQLMAYFAEGHGGFYIAAKDSQAGDKDLNFYKAQDDKSLTCEIAHISADARPGKSFMVDYPVVIAALKQGNWHEAARRYRSWAVEQPWCAKGTLRQRVAEGKASRWLLEEIGGVGMWWPFRQDIRKDLARARQFFGTPLLHLELWWSHEPSRKAAQSAGDRFGPFYFPFLALKGKKTFEARAADQIFPPATPIASDWVALCPAQPEWQKIVCESAEDMAGNGPLGHHQIWVDENRTGCNADCLYYDIGPCAGVPTHCYAPNHAHVPGAGGEITKAYVSLFEETHRRATEVKGAYVPVGTECASEPFVGCMDLYYARNAGFSFDMETTPYVGRLTWLPDGKMEIVPLFPFVYHEHGPVAVQGIYAIPPWGISEGDNYFAWSEAQSVLWGGLIVGYFPVASEPLPSKDRCQFIRSLVAARTKFARDYLAYGRMQRPPEIRCGMLEIDHGLAEGGWLRKIRFAKPDKNLEAFGMTREKTTDEGNTPKELSVEKWVEGMLAIPATPAQKRTFKVPAVMCQAYTSGNDRLGILLVNLRPDSEEMVRLPIDPVSCDLPKGKYELRQAGIDEQHPLGEFPQRREIELKLPPRTVVLVEAVKL